MQVTLDDIREAAEKKYGSFDIQLPTGTVSLLNPLRLPKAKRDRLIAMQEAEDFGEDSLPDMIHLIAATEAQAQNLLDAIGGDMALLATIMQQYSKHGEVGEA